MKRFATLAVALGLAGCGEEGEAPPRPQLDPPQAAEPPGGPEPDGTPSGETVPVGGTPEGVAIVDGVVGVAVDDPARLVLVDLESAEVLREVPLPGSARHVAAGAGRFLVPVEDADVLVQVPPRGAPVRTAVGDGPHDAVQLGSRIYTADEFGSTLSVVRDGELVGQVPVDAQPGGVTAIGDRVAVSAVRAYTVELYEGDADEPRGQGGQSAGLGPSHVVAVGSRLVIADTRGRALVVFDVTDRMRYARRIELEGTPLGLAEDDGEVWVTLSERNEAIRVDPADGRITETVTTGRNPFTVAAGDGALVIASQADGTLQIIR